jgi:hypothetical protein
MRRKRKTNFIMEKKQEEEENEEERKIKYVQCSSAKCSILYCYFNLSFM